MWCSNLKVLFYEQLCRYQSTANVPAITIPVYLKHKLKALERKEEKRKLKKVIKESQAGNKSVPVIQCKQSDYNHYLNQVYGKYDTIPLVSQYWKNRKYEGDYFTITAFGRNPSIPVVEETDEHYTFSSLNLNKDIVQRLENLNFHRPTVIQSLTIPKVLDHKNVVCSAETGSGKTIAYLAPIIHHLNNLKENQMKALPHNSPVVLILAPARELAQQIADVARKLAGEISVKLLVGGHFQQNRPNESHNIILVSTLGTLKSLVYRGIYDMRFIKHVVIDEADTMLDDSFNYSLKRFLRRIQFQETSPSQDAVVPAAQLILASATLPTNVNEVLSEIIDTAFLEKCVTNYLHRIVPHVPQKFIRVRGSRRIGPLLELVKSDVNRGNAVMIFCNKHFTCNWMHEFLADVNVNSIILHGEIPVAEREGRFEKFQTGESNVIICTDIASRGLDTTRVKHIINFDFPLNMSDYIHRVGRTGRIGSPQGCHATSFICTPYNVNLVNAIEMAVRKSKVLPGVDANIKRRLVSLSAQERLEE